MHMNDRKNGLRRHDGTGCRGAHWGFPVQFSRQRGASGAWSRHQKWRATAPITCPPVHGRMTAVWHLRPLRASTNRNRIDLRDIMERFLDWEFHGAFTPFGEAFDEGNTCSNAIYKYRDSHDLATLRRNGRIFQRQRRIGCEFSLSACISFRRKIFRMRMPFGKSIWQQGLTHNHLRCHIRKRIVLFYRKSHRHNGTQKCRF